MLLLAAFICPEVKAPRLKKKASCVYQITVGSVKRSKKIAVLCSQYISALRAIVSTRLRGIYRVLYGAAE